MKEEKLFEIVDSVDDDLICEMMEYSPNVKGKSEEYEGVLYSALEKARKAHYWQYPVTAAALMLAIVGALFIFNSGNTLPYNDGNQQSSTSNTGDAAGEITTADDPYTPVDTNIPYEFTQEDKELQKFLEDTVLEAEKFSQLYYSGDFGDISYSIEGDGVILVRFPQMEKALDKQINCHYAILPDELPFKTAAELEASLKQYYSAEVVSQCMTHVAVGEVIPGSAEEFYTVEIRERGYFDDNGFLYAVPLFIELNGRLYRSVSDRGGGFTPNWSMAKVISKTDDVLIFSFLGYDMYDIKEIRAGLGRLKYEDGWKYDWWDIYTPYEMVDFEAVWGTGGGTTQMTHIVPDKVVRIGTLDVMYTDTYPEFTAPSAGEAAFTEMGTVELMEYYGMENMVKEILEENFIEINDENTAHGIYTYPDGSVYDINVFTFKTSYDSLITGKKFTLTLGRETIFGREYSDEPNVWGTTPKYYNENRDTFFVIHELFGTCIMISGEVDGLTDYDDSEMKELYYYYNYSDVDDELWQGVPCELDLFCQAAVKATLHFAEGAEGPEKTEETNDPDICYSDYGLSSQTVSDLAVAAFLRNDREELSKYLADPSYEALSDGSENIYDRVVEMTWDVSDLTEKDGVYSMIYKIKLDSAEMLIHLNVGMREIDGEWKVEYIYLQG